MLIFPGHLTLRKAFTLCRSWWWVSDFGDKIGRRCLGNSIHEHTDEWNLEYDRKCKGKSEKNAFPITNPAALLFGREFDATEIRRKLRIVRLNLESSQGILFELTSSRIRLVDAK